MKIYQYFSDSASAECIVERPSINGSATPLAEFNAPSNSITISNCTAGTNSSGDGVGNVTHHYVTMWDGSTELAYPSSISSDGYSFPVIWLNRL